MENKRSQERSVSETLIMPHVEVVYRFCLRLCCGRVPDAEDLAQDVFVQAWQNCEGFAGRSKITTWLMRIALNRHLRLRSDTARRSKVTIDAVAEPTVSTADQTLERMELARALEALPDTLRTAFILVKVEGMKYREAADVLGVPTGTVQWQVHEAVSRLRNELIADAVAETPKTVVVTDNTKPMNQRREEVSHAV